MKAFLEDQLLEKGFGRDTVIVAVGGGVVSDLAGFVASTYMRGVPLIIVPTTLIGMVDASIGGKTGVNTSHGKNLIGSFYPPVAIVSDPDVLLTLPEKEMIAGRSEILKMGFVWDRELLDVSFEEQILRAIKAKIEVVSLDPKEGGLRKILNFGHTVGHALEAHSNFTMSHGEAVGIGCIAESYLSHHLGLLTEEELNRVVGLFPKFKWNFDRHKLISAMGKDKKVLKGAIQCVLLEKIGKARCEEIEPKDLHAMFDWMEHVFG
jgi:3-dehydroquinate synthase